MAGIKLFDYQIKAVEELSNGKILCGGVGSGKSVTAIAYYYILNGGQINTGKFVKMTDPCDLYIITTARKRDTFEWDKELGFFRLSTHPESNMYDNKVIVDSWNNIKKYVDVENAFFIFDEQRVVGSGAWVKAFLKITKKNRWILLTATPGDTWEDYIPVFIANGFYKNRTAFKDEHMVITWVNGKYPKVDRYLRVGKLIKERNSILVLMNFDRKTVSHHLDIYTDYDSMAYKLVGRQRWNPYTNAPIQNASELCYIWRRIVNSDDSRQAKVVEIFESHQKVIIFYCFDYELDILRNLYYGEDVSIAEWNGHKHQPIPKTDKWVYLVQYTAGAEGWNCVETNVIIFYSQNYSYKTMTQASGRIDRLNTPFTDLYFFHLKSRSGIDLAISKALKEKKEFNESEYVKNYI